MFHKKIFFLLAVTAAVALTGCGGEKEPAQEPSKSSTSEEAATENPVQAALEAAEEGSTEAFEALDPITPSDYLVEDVSDYITLASLDNLKATQTVYEITDEMVQETISEELYMYSEENEIEKAVEGSTVYADVTSTIHGDEDSTSEESTYFAIGDEDYGPEFDAKLTGCAAGDELEFSISYGDDTWFDEWANQTVDFKVNVTRVCETVIPEYTDDFVAENLDYATKEEYEAALRENLEDEYTQESYSETIDSLFQTVMEQATFNGYPEDLYASCEAEILAYYAQFVGTDDRTEIMNALGITEDDLEADVLNTVNLHLTICAICKEKELDVTEDEYVSSVTEEAEAYGYLSASEYEEASTREALVWNLYQNKAAEYLYDNAEITPVEATAEELYEDFDDLEIESETSDMDEFYAAELETEE